MQTTMCGSSGALYAASPALPSNPAGTTLVGAIAGASAIQASGAVVFASAYTAYVGADGAFGATTTGLRKVRSGSDGVALSDKTQTASLQAELRH